MASRAPKEASLETDSRPRRLETSHHGDHAFFNHSPDSVDHLTYSMAKPGLARFSAIESNENGGCVASNSKGESQNVGNSPCGRGQQSRRSNNRNQKSALDSGMVERPVRTRQPEGRPSILNAAAPSFIPSYLPPLGSFQELSSTYRQNFITYQPRR